MKAEIIYPKILEAKQLTISALEKKLGLANAAIANAIKNARQIKPATVEKILEVFPDLNREWILTGEGEMIKPPPGKGKKRFVVMLDPPFANDLIEKFGSVQAAVEQIKIKKAK